MLYSGLAVKQNLPLRTYIGLEPSLDENPKFAYFKNFTPSKKAFEDYPIANYPTQQKIINFVKKHLRSAGRRTGVKINVIHEAPPGCGLSASSSFSTALAAALEIYLQKLSIATVNTWPNLTSNELNNNQEFNKIFSLSWEIETILHGGYSSGSGPFASLISSPNPIVYACATGDSFKESKKSSAYYGIRIEELFNLPAHLDWPIDFGLIYAGDASEAGITIPGTKVFKETMEERVSLAKQELKKSPALCRILTSAFFKHESKDDLWQKLINAQNIASLMILTALREVMNKGLSESNLKKLFKSLNMAQRGLGMLSVSSPVIDYICLHFKREVARLQDAYGVGTKLTGKGRGGDILFVVAYHGLRDTIDKIITKMRRETGENFFLDYASWLDGFEPDGLKVEQSLAHGRYSHFVSRGAIQIKYIHQDGASDSRLYSLEQFNQDKTAMDILLDPAKHKILLKGKILTSKELRSASTTIKLLQILLSRPGQGVSNKELPPSSYVADRNELQSKIITPLTHAIAKHLATDISLKISGSIRNFSVTLKPGGVDYYVIERVF